jgi:hypothetical protein
MQSKASTIFYATFSVIAFSWMFSSSVAQDAPLEIGRYQSSTEFKQDGLNRIYVTVIDTETGEVVRTERYDPGDYVKGGYDPREELKE